MVQYCLIPGEVIVGVAAEQISILAETKISFVSDAYKQPFKSCPNHVLLRTVWVFHLHVNVTSTQVETFF